MDIEERVKFYLGDCSRKIPTNETVQHAMLHLDSNRYYIHNEDIFSLERAQNIYIDPLRNLIKEYGVVINKNIHTMPGDVSCESLDLYALSKTRLVNEVKHNFILVKCFEQQRHWKHCSNTDNIRYENKLNKAVWRGSLTGQKTIDSDGHIIKTRQSNRITLLENHRLKNYADIALTEIPQKTDFKIKSKYAHMIEPRTDIQYLRNYKYIISIEGNDKDSGLNWKLMSNSVVLMAKPIYNSWLMEEKLMPNFHYVELKDDLSDLEEKINWCNENPTECKDIINNAHEYMKQFFDEKSEKIIERNVITTFIENTNV